MGHSATMLVPVVSVRDLVMGYNHNYGLPADFLERLKTTCGRVSLGTGWQRISDAFEGSADITRAAESDLLCLNAENEAEALVALEAMALEPPKDCDVNEYQRTVDDAAGALEVMRAEREALGMDDATWELG